MFESQVGNEGYTKLSSPGNASEKLFFEQPDPMKIFETQRKYVWKEWVEEYVCGAVRSQQSNRAGSRFRAIYLLQQYILETIWKGSIKDCINDDNRVQMTAVLSYILGKRNSTTKSRSGGINAKEWTAIFQKDGAQSVCKVFEYCFRGDFQGCDKYLGRNTG